MSVVSTDWETKLSIVLPDTTSLPYSFTCSGTSLYENNELNFFVNLATFRKLGGFITSFCWLINKPVAGLPTKRTIFNWSSISYHYELRNLYKLTGRTWGLRCVRGRVTTACGGGSGARRGKPFFVLPHTKTWEQAECPPVAREYLTKFLFRWSHSSCLTEPIVLFTKYF
jgi:hypothetical protein